MPNTEKNSPQPPSKTRGSEEAAVSKQLEKDADEMAGKAEKDEQQYDEDHDIFTK